MKKIILFGLLPLCLTAFLSCAHSFKDSVEMMTMDPSERKAYLNMSEEHRDTYLQVDQENKDKLRLIYDSEYRSLKQQVIHAENKYDSAVKEFIKAKGAQYKENLRKQCDQLQKEYLDLQRQVNSLRNKKLKEYAEARKAWKEKTGKMDTMDTGGCFTPDTLVLMKTGFKRIADVKVGDRVQTVDENGIRSVNKVVEHYIFTNRHYFLINGGIKVTSMHRFYTPKGWVRAGDLKMGDQIQTSDGLFEEIISKEMFFADLTVYNLNIADNHNFFVSSDGKKGYLVHNTAGGGK